MRIIKRAPLDQFARKHPKAKTALETWIAVTKEAKWKDFTEVRQHFGTADIVEDNRIIFNIGGNKYRLVVHANFRTQTLFVKFIGTHTEYDKIDVATVRI